MLSIAPIGRTGRCLWPGILGAQRGCRQGAAFGLSKRTCVDHRPLRRRFSRRRRDDPLRPTFRRRQRVRAELARRARVGRGMSPFVPVVLVVLVCLSAPAMAQPVGLLESAACRGALEALSHEEDRLRVHAAASVPRGMAHAPSLASPVPPSGPASHARGSALPALQRTAAIACLGGAGAAQTQQRVPAPAPDPVLVPGPSRVPAPPASLPGFLSYQLPPPGVARAPSPAPTSAPVRQAPLPTLTGCDAQGCWASDGTRVQRLGPVLIGPRGHCTQTGPFLNCP